MIWRWQPDSESWEKQTLDIQDLGNLEDQPLFINPGSASAFRDFHGCASFMVVDWEAGKIIHRRIPYDYSWIYHQMEKDPYRPLREEKNFLIKPRCY